MVARGKESVADVGRTRMAGERINNPATKSGCSSVGRTPHLGCGGREFKSHHSDQPPIGVLAQNLCANAA